MFKTAIFPGNYSKQIDLSLLIIRLTAGGFMLTHGMGKLIKLFGDNPIQFADPIGIGVTASLILTVFAEVFCSIFLILGLITRFSAIPLLITMLVAAFVVHAGDGFGKQELPLFYASSYVILLIAGSGKWSLDRLITNHFANR